MAIHLTHVSLLLCVEGSPPSLRAGDVEWVISCGDGRVVSSVHDECVPLIPLDHQLRDERAVDVPRNTPPRIT